MGRSAPPDATFYFAYGSNLHPRWLRRRVPSAVIIGPATLPGHALEFRKRGRDGSAKCAAIVSDSARAALPGALYSLREDELGLLGAAEGGYRRQQVRVGTTAGPVLAWTWYAETEQLADGLAPWDWYLGLVLAGADYHRLSQEHRRRLAAVRAQSDPDESRARPARAILASPLEPPAIRRARRTTPAQ